MIQANDTARNYRTIWISDLHLGTAGCQAAALLEFLKQHESETLYLVGDIIDGWQLKKKWYWPQSHNDVVQKILRKARKGTRVVYVPGNHDSFARQYTGEHFGGIEVHLEAEHTTLKGQCLLITHGDLFDGVIQYAPWLAYLGDRLYSLVLAGNVWFNRARAHMGLGYWSLSQYLKHKVKDAVSFITAFEDALIKEARRRGFDGVVCGHIHKAQIREVDGILYCNDGDWVESLTALVEHLDGSLEIITWIPEASPKPRKARARQSAPAPATTLTQQAVPPNVETETVEGVTSN
ncbi:UDP-2,3-diacylglucosamine diphosphatase [Pusillimonas sp. MFBS29]|uniref:UDP-2,3-diacylglucosamine diphosphatase n=1 Tax=Pusillimonas sp. MFBS29 TaxID=2886690 RepID=UPI001D0F906B|nr:UDP-2,3-diacylglucosamine diphosphatase [Pusillimonas sp. MFBS29]MCC2595567.1 UDP-2,3-diacylglucosamine diphosphatase [Pusillimonas sp. MFBS29]